MSYSDRRAGLYDDIRNPMPDGRQPVHNDRHLRYNDRQTLHNDRSTSHSGRQPPHNERQQSYNDRNAPVHGRRSDPYDDIEIEIPDRRGVAYDEDSRSHIERGRGSQKSRGSVRSRGSYGSSGPPVRPLGERIKNCCRLTIAFIFSNVGVCGLFVGYTIMGSFLFQAIEKDAWKHVSVEWERNRTVDNLWNITHYYNNLDFVSWNHSSSAEVKRYQRYMIKSIVRGYAGNDDPDSYDPWSFEGGFLYSLTVITTIGYGHISPRTVNGKVMTIVYTIFGMPVFLLYMANMGDILAKSLKWTYARVCICKQANTEQKYQPSVVWRSAAAILSPVDGEYDMERERRPGDSELEDDSLRDRRLPPAGYPIDMEDQVSIATGSWRSERSERPDENNVNIPITVSLVILFALLYGGTEMFRSFEDWDRLTSFYFCFISLTTIGFGDFVPGSSATSDQRINFIYCSLYLMFGLALLSMCFNLMQEEVVHKVTMCMKSVTFFKRRVTGT